MGAGKVKKVCCRYWADLSPDLRGIVEEMNRSPLLQRWEGKASIRTAGEIRPSDVAPVIACNRRGDRSVFPMRWGFRSRSLLVNARVETASEKPAFREAWAAHRCVVPASWYFEWEHLTTPDGKRKTGLKYRIRPKDSAMTWLCGLYRMEEGLPAFVILTREPGESIRFIHNRMPLILPEDLVDAWITPGEDPAALATKALTDMTFDKAV